METLVISAQQPCCIQIPVLQPLRLAEVTLQHLELKSLGSGMERSLSQIVQFVHKYLKKQTIKNGNNI